MTPAKAIAVVPMLILGLVAGAAFGETVKGRYSATGAEPEYVFWPRSDEKVEITLTWLRKSVNLDLFVRCVDEIGMEYLVLMSESGHDRIEHLEFGGWSGGTCYLSIRTVDASRATTYLLNIQGSLERTLTATTASNEAN